MYWDSHMGPCSKCKEITIRYEGDRQGYMVYICHKCAEKDKSAQKNPIR